MEDDGEGEGDGDGESGGESMILPLLLIVPGSHTCGHTGLSIWAYRASNGQSICNSKGPRRRSIARAIQLISF